MDHISTNVNETQLVESCN